MLSTSSRPRTISSGSPRPRKDSAGSQLSPRLRGKPQRLGVAYSAELLNTQLLKQAVRETIGIDKEHISSRAGNGVSPSFKRFPERQAFSELPSSKCEITQERKLQ